MNLSIGVVIPTHNRRNELMRAIESVLGQSVPVQEIWVIDDASEEAILPLQVDARGVNIHYYRLPLKANANVARNEGARRAETEFIAFLDSDDEWDTGHIEYFVQNYDPTIPGYFGAAKIYRQFGDQPIVRSSIHLEEVDSPMNFLLGGGFAQTSSFIVKRKEFLECRFDITLQRHQDYDFFVRFYQQYRWKQLTQPTVILHWEKGRVVTRKAADEMVVIRRYRHLISTSLLKRYLFIQFDYYLEHGTKHDFMLHQQEVDNLIHCISLSEYWAFHKDESHAWGKLKWGMIFLIRKCYARIFFRTPQHHPKSINVDRPHQKGEDIQ